MPDRKPVLLVIEDDPGLQAQLKWAYDDFEVVIAGDRDTANRLTQELVDQMRRNAPRQKAEGSSLPPPPR